MPAGPVPPTPRAAPPPLSVWRSRQDRGHRPLKEGTGRASDSRSPRRARQARPASSREGEGPVTKTAQPPGRC